MARSTTLTFTGIEYDEGDVGVLELSDNRAHVELLASLSYTAEISYESPGKQRFCQPGC